MTSHETVAPIAHPESLYYYIESTIKFYANLGGDNTANLMLALFLQDIKQLLVGTKALLEEKQARLKLNRDVQLSLTKPDGARDDALLCELLVEEKELLVEVKHYERGVTAGVYSTSVSALTQELYATFLYMYIATGMNPSLTKTLTYKQTNTETKVDEEKTVEVRCSALDAAVRFTYIHMQAPQLGVFITEAIKPIINKSTKTSIMPEDYMKSIECSLDRITVNFKIACMLYDQILEEKITAIKADAVRQKNDPKEASHVFIEKHQALFLSGDPIALSKRAKEYGIPFIYMYMLYLQVADERHRKITEAFLKKREAEREKLASDAVAEVAAKAAAEKQNTETQVQATEIGGPARDGEDAKVPITAQ